MQKESIKDLPVFFDPITLPGNFPITRPAFDTPPPIAHVHNCFEIGLCQSGAGIFLVSNKVFSCMEGDAIFINNHEFHVLEKASPLNSDWKFINLDPEALLAGWVPPEEKALDISRLSGRGFLNVVHEKDHPDIVFLVRTLVLELENEKEGYPSMVRSLVWGLLVLLQRLVPEKDTAEENNPVEIKRIYPALKYISMHYMETVEIPVLAELCHCSLSTFRRTFKRSLGRMPLDYVNYFRLKVATSMLKSTSRPVLEIALRTGFPTLSNFNRIFKAKFKKSPRDYRRSGGNRSKITCPKIPLSQTPGRGI